MRPRLVTTLILMLALAASTWLTRNWPLPWPRLPLITLVMAGVALGCFALPRLWHRWRQAAPLRLQRRLLARELGCGLRPDRRPWGLPPLRRPTLPCYVVAGSAGSGKTALLHEGLPSLTPAPGPWVKTPQGQFLDLPATCWEGPEADPAWGILLRLLRRHRRPPALQGLLFCLPLTDFLAMTPARRTHLAQHLATRLAEARDRLHQDVPVHLLLTQADRVEGGVLLAPGGHPWGQKFPINLPDAPWDPLPPCPIHGISPRHHLGHRLIRPSLRHALDALLEGDTPGHPPLRLRSLHLVWSGLGPSGSLSQSRRVAARFGLPTPPSETQPRAASPLPAFFRSVLLPDAPLASPRRRPSTLPLFSLALCVGALGLWLWGRSFHFNRLLLTVTSAEAIREGACLASSAPLHQRLEALQRLQARGLQLKTWTQSGPPRAMAWGLHPGQALSDRLRPRQDRHLEPLLLAPLCGALESSLTAFLAGQLPAESAYPLLKAYLMLGLPERREASFLTQTLPPLWATWLTSQAPSDEARQPLLQAGGRLLSTYLARLSDPRLPGLQPDPTLVASVRLRLSGTFAHLPPHEQLYGQCQSLAAARFPALSLSTLVEHPAPLRAEGPLAGTFTRAAWEGNLREALGEAAAGRVGGGDWVLDGDRPQELARLGSREDAMATLEQLHRTAHRLAWQDFVRGIDLPPWTHPAEAIQGLERLADPRESPLRRLVIRVAQEAAWTGSPSSGVPAGLRRHLPEGATRWLGNASAPEPTGHPLPSFPRLAGQDQGQAALAPYLTSLDRIRQRLAAVQAAPDPAQAARICLALLQSGGCGEWAEGLAAVDQGLLAQADPEERTLLRPLFLRPLHQAAQALVLMAEQDLQRTWQREVLGPWSTLAARYPFADTTHEVPWADLAAFLHPSEGPLARFRQSLGPLAIPGAPRPSPWPAPRLHPASLLAAQQIHALSERLFPSPGPFRFECQVLGTRGIREIQLEIDGQRCVYRNGRETWVPMSWPGPSRGTRLAVIGHEGTGTTLLASQGPLGLLRLLACARPSPGPEGATVLEWPCPPGERAVRILLRPLGGLHPLHLLHLRHLTLPQRITP